MVYFSIKCYEFDRTIDKYCSFEVADPCFEKIYKFVVDYIKMYKNLDRKIDFVSIYTWGTNMKEKDYVLLKSLDYDVDKFVNLM